MVHSSTQLTPTQRVVARLRAEGWLDCPDLGFPALVPCPMSELRSFILTQLQATGGWMELTELQLQTLIFSIPAHEFQFHPGLKSLLAQLEAEGFISRQPLPGNQRPNRKPEVAIVLSPQYQIQSA